MQSLNLVYNYMDGNPIGKLHDIVMYTVLQSWTVKMTRS